MGIHNLTNHIIAVANENHRTINNIQLQKILYFTLRYSVPLIGLENAKEIYDKPFLVWQYGPILKSEYDRFYTYGTNPIIEDLPQSEKYKRLNKLIIRLLDMDVFRMINASRTHNFWKQNKNKIINGRSTIKYPLNEVLREN